MYAIFKRELSLFFSTAIGYIVIAIFLILTALLLWIFPGSYNICNSGYASVDSLFTLAPWLYLFLCPAITMRLFAEEKQSGTIELLLTKPVSKLKIVLAKALAAFVLVLLALIPTLIWYGVVCYLAEPAGNVDSGQFWGSWIGLIMLAMIYCSIGLFGSAITKNQIVAFISSALICFFLYYGFDLVSTMFSGLTATIISEFGIKYHYSSMARGVIDSRDVVYFLFLSAIFIISSKKILR